jgi:hypothetical protein
MSGSLPRLSATETAEFEPIARAMAEWSNPMPWEARAPKNREHWLRVASRVMQRDELVATVKNALVYGDHGVRQRSVTEAQGQAEAVADALAGEGER